MRFGAVIFGALLLGCIIPQEDQFLDELPPLKNRPPRIVSTNVGNQSAPEVNVALGANCPQVVFESWVEDPDINDRIRHFWFVDYDPAGPLINRRPHQTGFVQPNGSELRESIKLEIAPESVDNPLPTEGSHVVQLVVTDGLLEITDPPGTIPPPDPVPGLDAGNPRYATSWVWLVDVDNTACEGATP